MSDISEYIDFSSVRSALGVSTAELTDTVLADRLYWISLKRELQDINSDILDDYTTTLAKETKTADEQTFLDDFYLFTTYSVAKACTGALPLFSPKTISEDKSNQTRYSDSPYKETVKAVRANFDLYRYNLNNSYTNLSTGSSATDDTPLTRLGISTPSIDPVTGE